MTMLSNQDLEKVVAFLKSLPRRSDPSRRSDSWRTTDQLLSLFPSANAPINSRELDAALCKWFLTKEDCPIRPAYYPSEDNCKRFWGHLDNVGPGPGRQALRDKLSAHPHDLESDNLEDDAPIFFLSHAMEDHHFAARVRFNLARHGIRSWLAEGDLHEGSNLFEAVEAALNRCDALMILLSSFSITSAWVYTEVLTALKSDKRTVALIDASDAQICTLLHGWMTENQKNLRGETHGNWLDSAEGISASSKVLERYMRVASPTRLLKFRENLNFTLKSSTMEGFVAFYPTVPQALKKNGALWNGFDAAIEYLGIQKL